MASSPERAELVQEANIDLNGWLQRVVNLWQATKEVAGRQPAQYGDFRQLVGLPKGMSVDVSPQGDTKLEGWHHPSTGVAGLNGESYDAANPFEGGALVEASIHQVNPLDLPEEERPEGAAIALDLVCLKRDNLGIFTTLAYNFDAHGVLVPGGAIDQVGFEIVDRPPAVSPSPVR